jgi:elongation factor G
MGVGFFKWEYDHLQEVPDKITANVLATTDRGNGNGNGR